MVKSKNANNFSVVDLGCGDGRILFSLQQNRLLSNATKIVGVDLSPERIENFRKTVKSFLGIVSDVCYVKELRERQFDCIICNQVIEHIPEDHSLIREMSRLLKDDGVVYISSIIKMWYGVWIYRAKGSFRLDPTHVREYSSKEEFINLIEENGLKVFDCNVSKTWFPLLDIVIRTLIKLELIETSKARNIYIRTPWVEIFRKLKIPIFGYHTIEVLCKKAGK